MFYKTKKSALLCHFEKCFMNKIGGVSDRRWHDSLSMYYIDKESYHRLSETPPILCIKHVKNNGVKRNFWSYSTHEMYYSIESCSVEEKSIIQWIHEKSIIQVIVQYRQTLGIQNWSFSIRQKVFKISFFFELRSFSSLSSMKSHLINNNNLYTNTVLDGSVILSVCSFTIETTFPLSNFKTKHIFGIPTVGPP